MKSSNGPGRGRRRDTALRTQRSFGLLWRETADGAVAATRLDHFTRAAQALGLGLPTGARRILDAGCGDGSDLRTLCRSHPDSVVVGLDAHAEPSVPAAAVRPFPHGHMVRGSVLEPPFRTASFDLVYSYGVLHHTESPADAFCALARLVSPGGGFLVYVYSDLREAPVLRRGVAAATRLRSLTTRVPPRAVMLLASALAPVVFLLFALPAAVLRRVPGLSGAAERLPFNFVKTPTGAVGDLYDRFSAPIEFRHSRAEVHAWYHQNGFTDITVTTIPGLRGWVGFGRAPCDDGRGPTPP